MAVFNRLTLGQSRAAVAQGPQWPRMAIRALLSLGLAGLFLFLLSARIAEVDLAAVAQALDGLTWGRWAGAVAFTAISFWAVGHYDAVLHRHFVTGLPDALTRRAGICAIAVSQTLGLGVITGAILRWRMLPGQSLWQAARLTTAVALSFLAGWAVVTAVVLIVLPGAPFKPAATAVLALALALVALALVAPRVPFRWPNSFTLSRLIVLCAVDTVAAALCFYWLCPDPGLGFATLLPAFLLALGAGLASGAPGGIGAFEVTLLALLPGQSQPSLLAAILAWRLTYYALPALIGALVAIRGPGRITPQRSATPRLTDHPRRRAETGILSQGEHHVLPCGAGAWLTGRSGHFMVGLFDPTAKADLTTLTAAAHAESRAPALYKCNARTAAVARRQGFAPLLIAREAWLRPNGYRLQASSRAGLRRKLRRAEAAGVTVTQPSTPPWQQLDAIAANWSKLHGGERGFSMGRYDRTYVAGQRLYVAWVDNKAIAFASFHTAPTEWTLDLMRHANATPDGTMHALIQVAITDAAQAGVPRLSLSAVPEAAFGTSPHRHIRLLRALAEDDGAGLAQFKSCFAPHWQPLYMATKTRAGLPFAAAAIARAILHPPPIEQDHADYEFASAPHPWQRQA